MKITFSNIWKFLNKIVFLCTHFGTQFKHIGDTIMKYIQVSAREFRANQKKYFELADQGKQVVIRRWNKQSYFLVPAIDKDAFFTPDDITHLKDAIEQAKRGEVKRLTDEEFKELIGL